MPIGGHFNDFISSCLAFFLLQINLSSSKWLSKSMLYLAVCQNCKKVSFVPVSFFLSSFSFFLNTEKVSKEVLLNELTSQRLKLHNDLEKGWFVAF